jgi:hypothetical protein
MVATGLVALEGIAAGCKVVTASREDGGSLVDVITPARWSVALRTNFLGLDGRVIDPAEAWERLDRVSDQDRNELVALLRRDASPRAALDALLAGERRESPVPADRAAVAAAACWINAEARFEEVRRWLPQVEEARDYFRERSEHFEKLVEDLSRGPE